MMQKEALTDFLLRLLFPERCIFCERVLPFGEKWICEACSLQEKYLTGDICMKCGKQLLEEEEEYCPDCKRIPHKFRRGIALYQYPLVAPALYRFKYGGKKKYASFFGEEISKYMEEILRDWKVQGIVPVPMYRKKQRKRGYNQAQCLAREIGRRLCLPVYDGLVIRSRNTVPMKNLNPEQRRNNLKNAFHIVPIGVKLDNIVIVDDIYTTGSTVDSIAELLIAYGVKNVYVITLAIGNGM